ncbi:MAG: hypothetical protein QOE41_2015 [Mycobacterium sp.]|jgi:hypothetical protein|nr:hypothetical protein [Mycobacterium sp.]MDT5132704.1 hypothetical protein [Mycobacterium sp.]
MTTLRELGGLRSPDTVDRVLVIACAVIWLAFIGVGVAAVVALVDLGSGRRPETASGSQTPWLLYAVIAISALIILGAIPLLLRARRSALDEPPRTPARPSPRAVNYGPSGGSSGLARSAQEASTEKLRVFGPAAEPADRAPGNRPRRSPRLGGLSPEVVDRMWLRVTVAIAGAMGVAMLAVATASYLMAVDKNNSAWTALGIAAILTVAMPAIPWLALRQLRNQIAAAR